MPTGTTPQPTTPPVQLQITLSNLNPQVGEVITLLVTNTGPDLVTSASWSFGDGATATGAITSHGWMTARTYLVNVQATTSGGQQATTSVSIQVSP